MRFEVAAESLRDDRAPEYLLYISPLAQKSRLTPALLP